MMPNARYKPKTGLTPGVLKRQTVHYRGKGGTSAEACCVGFAPAFLDCATNTIYRACFANGTPAPMHLLDGLPEELILARDSDGRVVAIKETVVSGFVKDDVFYTRDQAALLVNKLAP